MSDWINTNERKPEKSTEDILFYVDAERRTYRGCYNRVRGLWFGRVGDRERRYTSDEISRWRTEEGSR